MSKSLFNEIIIDKQSWKRYRNSKEIFMPLIKHIYETNHLKFDEVFSTPESSNAIFRINNTIIKIFYPPETSIKDPREYETELFGIKHCNNVNVLTSDIICTGIVHDNRYNFPYIVMNYIDGIVVKDALLSYTNSEKIELALKLKELTNKIHVTTDLKLPRYDESSKINHILWNNMPESFREDRKLYIANANISKVVFTHGDFIRSNIIIDHKKRLHLIDLAESCIAPYYYDNLAFSSFGREPIIMQTYYGDYKNDDFYNIATISILLKWFNSIHIQGRANELGIDFTSITNVAALKDMLIKWLDV